MKHISPTDAKVVGGFLKEQRFRHAQTRKIYGGILRGFQRFVSQHAADGSLSVSILQQWLKGKMGGQMGQQSNPLSGFPGGWDPSMLMSGLGAGFGSR